MLATSKGHFNQHFKIIFADAPPYFQLHYKTNFFWHNFPWFVNVLKSVSNLKVTKSQNLSKLVDIDVTALEESFDIWRSEQTHSVMILNHYFWSWRVSWECYNGCGVVSWYWVSPVLLPHSWSQVVTGRETSFSWFLVTSSAWCQVVTRLGPHQRTQLLTQPVISRLLPMRSVTTWHQPSHQRFFCSEDWLLIDVDQWHQRLWWPCC